MMYEGGALRCEQPPIARKASASARRTSLADFSFELGDERERLHRSKLVDIDFAQPAVDGIVTRRGRLEQSHLLLPIRTASTE